MIFTIVLFKLKVERQLHMIIIVAIITWCSYAMVMFKVHEFVPLPTFLVPLQILLFRYIYGIRIRLAIVAPITATLCYGGVLQGGLSFLCLKIGYLTNEDLLITFAVKSYTMQSLCSVIILVVSFYIKYFNEGFDISLYKKHPVRFFMISIFIAFFMIIGSFIGFTLDTTEAYITLYFILAISGALFILFTIKRIEKAEFE